MNNETLDVMDVSMSTLPSIGYHTFLSGCTLIWRPCHFISGSKVLLFETMCSTEKKARVIQDQFIK